MTWSVYQQRGVLSDDAHRELRDEVRRVLVWCGVPIDRGLHEHLHQRASLWSGEPQRSFGSLTGFSLSLLGRFCPGMALSGFKRCISCLRAAMLTTFREMSNRTGFGQPLERKLSLKPHPHFSGFSWLADGWLLPGWLAGCWPLAAAWLFLMFLRFLKAL